MSENDANARYLREVVVEPDAIARARNHAVELGADPIHVATGAQIAVLAAATGAKSIVEIGTGAGVSGLWLMRGAPQAVLTSIDNEPEHLTVAKRSFQEAGVPATRARFISGAASDVLPRMNEAAYDIVLIDADPENIIDYLAHSLRLVRTGGLVLIPRVLSGGKVADPVTRDDVTGAYRTLIQETQQSPAVLASLSNVGDGLLQLVSLTQPA